MKKWSFLVVFVLPLLVQGQHFIPFHFDTLVTSKQSITLDGTADISGNALGTDIFSKFLFGGAITDEMKAKSLDRHVKFNRFGGDINAELEYRNDKVNFAKMPEVGFLVKAGMYNFTELIYGKDVFQFAMYGNQPYVGDTVSLSGTQFRNLTYSKIGFGLTDKRTKSSISLNLVGLQNYTTIGLTDFQMYQSAEQDTLTVKYDGSTRFSNGSSFLKGMGFSLDFDIRLMGKSARNNPVYFQIMAKNLGVVFANKIQEYTSDSQMTLTGFSYNELSNASSLLKDNQRILDTLGIQQRTVRHSLFLPGMIQASKLVDVNSKRIVQEFYGARMYLSRVYIPQVFAGLNIKPFNGFNLGMSIAYGGFSKLKGGAYLAYATDKINIGVSSENLFSKTGVSYLIRLQCAF